MKNSDDMSSCCLLTTKTIRLFSLVLCACLLITNWLCLVLIYLIPNLIQSSSLNLCIFQSYFLHVLILFHLHLIICLRLYWHYCFIFKSSCSSIFFILLFIFICLCLFTLPSISHEWTSIIFDEILQICIVNYTFNYSYTFFILTLTCLIPFLFLIISHKQQMKSIENRISKYLLMNQKVRFQSSSYLILLWSFLHILFLIFLHIPIQYKQIRIVIYYIHVILFLFEPILYIFLFRLLSLIILLRSTNEIYFI